MKKILLVVFSFLCICTHFGADAKEMWDAEITFEKQLSTGLYQEIQSFDGTCETMVKVSIYGDAPKCGLILASYDGGQLLSIKKTDVDMGTFEKRVPADTSHISKSGKIKVFLWESENILSPAVKAKELTWDEKKILSFVIDGKEAEIYHGTGEIITDVRGEVSPIITVSEGASVTPSSGELVDLSGDVFYTVTAADGSKAKYRVCAPKGEDMIQTLETGDYAENFEKNGVSVSFKDYDTAKAGTLGVSVMEEDGEKFLRLNDFHGSPDTGATGHLFASVGMFDENERQINIRDSGFVDIKVRFNAPITQTNYYSPENCYLLSRDGRNYYGHYTYFSSDSKWMGIKRKPLQTVSAISEGIEYGKWYTFRFYTHSVADARENATVNYPDEFAKKYQVSYAYAEEGGEFIFAPGGNNLVYNADAFPAALKTAVLYTREKGQISCDIASVKAYDTAFDYTTQERLEKIFKDMDMLIDRDALLWLAGLYDSESGGFYYNTAARDTEGYYPTLESTAWAYTGITGAGIRVNPGYVPESFAEKALEFARERQSEEDGYFYDIQFGKDVTETKKTRDLGAGLGIIERFGGKPKYLTPTERLYQSSARALSLMSNTAPDTSHLSEIYHSRENYRAWLETLDLDNCPYEHGSEMSATFEMATELGYDDIAVEYLKEHQDPETGLWGKTLTNDSINCGLKVVFFFNKNTEPFPYLDKMIDSVIYIMENEGVPGGICHIWNRIAVITEALESYDESSLLEVREKIQSKIAKMLEITLRHTKEYRRSDGGYANCIDYSAHLNSGAQVSPEKSEGGDTNALALVHSIINSSHILAGVPRENYFNSNPYGTSGEIYNWFWEQVMN